jgi:ornithine decarboxylase
MSNTSAAAERAPDMLYQNDGVYGNFMNVVMETERMAPGLHKPDENSLATTAKKQGHGEGSQGKYRYSIWGPTCDSIDCVTREATFDSEVQVGDWLTYRDMGGKWLPWVRKHVTASKC